jgi:hypothetical protein
MTFFARSAVVLGVAATLLVATSLGSGPASRTSASAPTARSGGRSNAAGPTVGYSPNYGAAPSHAATAYKEKLPMWQAEFARNRLQFPPAGLFLRVFKKEAVLEVWVAQKAHAPMRRLRTYRIAASSGVLGPKRRDGDRQVPEGFYHVACLNPASSYYLSVKIDYPNASDRILGGPGRLGKDIYIHGNRVSIGCIPVTDKYIKELWVLVSEYRRVHRNPIQVHIFPCRLDAASWIALCGEHMREPGFVRFWANIKNAFDAFERTRRVPAVHVDRHGRYVVRAGG